MRGENSGAGAVVADLAQMGALTSEFYGFGSFAKAFFGFLRAVGRAGEDACGNTSDQPGQSGLAVTVGGEGTAIGDSTRTIGAIESTIVDYGAVTVATGEASVSAMARSPRGEQTVVDAETFLEVEGADFVFSFTLDTHAGRSTRHETWASETSELHYIAIDIEGFELAGGPIEVESSRDRRASNAELARGDEPAPWEITGHLAEASAKSDVYGGDAGFTQAFTETFVNDTVSLSSAFTYGAII